MGWGTLHAGAGAQPRKGNKHTVSHTLAAGGALPGVAEMTVWPRVHCLLSFAQCGPLNWSLRGTVLHQTGWIFIKPMKFKCSWDRYEAGNHYIHKTELLVSFYNS